MGPYLKSSNLPENAAPTAFCAVVALAASRHVSRRWRAVDFAAPRASATALGLYKLRHLLSFPRSALSIPRRGSPPPHLLTRATAVATPSYCRRHPPLAPVAASASEEAGTVGSGDPGLLVGGSGHPEARGNRLSPSLLFSFYIWHRYNDGRADRVRQRAAAP
uniref:Uncharacterized protein n=1 Tax=Oryza meridionalis TaxID=40149 RepID=A0A0E0EHP2_9ORYZ